MVEPFEINEESGVPVWLQIRNHLVFCIKSGKLLPGEKLPTVREFAAQIGVNYNTIHRVYQDLETDGLINSSRGKKSMVADVQPADIETPSSPVDTVIAELIKTAEECRISKEDVFMRLEEQYAKFSR